MPSPADLGDFLPLTVAAVAGYLLGALPFGFLVARSHGVNIFEVGSRSPGATNVRRVLGKGPGNTVFFLDTLKGIFAAGWPLLAFMYVFLRARQQTDGSVPPMVALGVIAEAYQLAFVMGYVGLAFALIGHSFSCFTRFRGGKGVATAAGGLLVLMPYVALISAAIWVILFYSTRYVSLASIIAALTLPVLAVLFSRGPIGVCVASLIALFVVVRHRANIRRLLGGTEKKFDRRRDDGGPPAAGAEP
jgi:acyl phosphate:glycerol-3-phosphate acyltransferase